MNIKKILLNGNLRKIITYLFENNSTRKLLLKIIENKFYKNLIVKNPDKFPEKLQEDKFMMLKSLIKAIDRGLENGLISKKLISNFIQSFGSIYLNDKNKIENFRKRYGYSPPAFLTISPTKLCNLNCVGCYANSYKGSKEKLEYEVVSRIIKEQKELWDSHFTVISGGEPLAYRSNRKSIFDLAEEHRDTFFLMYTNGTLINDTVAKRLAELGNITPAISVEGFEKETDERRGRGIFKRILNAFDNLRKYGVPFGISITATIHNAEIILEEDFIDFYFNKQGALYGWIFQYMPIGRKYTLDLMVTPEQRVNMYLKTWKYIREKQLFLADFWNCGTVSSGCISAGREGGYIYIDWNGNVMPCVFNPYKIHNILKIYKNGENLNAVLFSEFFKEIRQWQNNYFWEKLPNGRGNLLAPCPIRDHYDMMYDLIRRTGALAANEDAEQALKDYDYYKKLAKYGKEYKKLSDEIWEDEYIGQKEI